MNKHTPGPWLVGEHRIGLDGDADEIDVVSKGDSRGDHSICTVDEAWEGCIEANARLIAAAPDMLAELERLIDAVGEEDVNCIEAVIRRANGEAE